MLTNSLLTNNKNPDRLLTRMLLAAVLAAGPTLTAQAQTQEQDQNQNQEIPRTLEGRPDLQGIWTNGTQTPLQRPSRYGDQRTMSAEEALDMQQGAQQREQRANAPSDPDRAPPTDGNTAAAYNTFWLDRGSQVVNIDGEYRTSMIIDPADGQIPFRDDAPEQNLMEHWRDIHGDDAFLGPEMATIGERCLLFYDFRTSNSSAGPPMMPIIYNSNYQIVQTPDYVVITAEMMHDARIIRLQGEHLPPEVHKWMGDSVGHWDGDTLVVTTRNMHPQQSHYGSGPGLEVTETFRMTTAGEIVYSFTMNDPVAYTQPWTAEMVLYARPEGDRIYEYACHEGNYALPGILAGKRRQEQQAE